MGKTLIAYFSHEGENYVGGSIVTLPIGNTRVAAEMIAEMTKADVFRIVPVMPYPTVYSQTTDTAKRELSAKERPAFQGDAPDLSQYDTLILGYPNWWGTIPMVVATFLESVDMSGKTILPLCTNEGSGMGSSERDILRLCHGATLRKGLPLLGGQVNNAKSEIARWLVSNGIVEEK